MYKPAVRVAVVLLLWASSAWSVMLRNVPADFPTIQAAINVSATNDTVMVAPGTYVENLDFGTRTVRVLSSGGDSVTTLKTNPVTPGSPLVRFLGSGAGTEFSGFTLDGGDMKHAVEIKNGSQPWFHHNVIVNHVSFESNATEIGSYASGPVIEFNVFVHNRSIGGVGIFSGSALIANNTFDDNSRGFWSQGTGVVAKNNIVTNSVQFGVGDDNFQSSDFNCVFNNNPNYAYGAVPGASDINVWPDYCDSALDNFGLDAISPCLATGEGGANRGAFGATCGAGIGPRVIALTASGGQVTHVTDPTPDISWTYFDPAGQPQTETEVEVSSDPDWTVAEMWDPPTFPGPATVQTYAGAALIDGATYYLRARVNNGIEWGLWSVRTFHMNTPPPVPLLNSPADSVVVSTASPQLSAQPQADAEGDPQSFSFEVYSDEALTILVATGTNIPSPWTVSPALVGENMPKWWRARANDGFEVGAWTSARVFFLDAQNSPPTPGQLLFPIGNIAVPSTAPHFDWDQATDPDPGQTDFVQTLILATDSNFFFSVQVSNLPQSEFIFGGLSVAQRYWWKIRFTDPDGLSADSPPQSFFIPGPGDMNMNLGLNVVDVVMVVDVAFRGVPAPDAIYLADVNGDCVLDIRDVVRIIDHVFRSGPLPLTICLLPSDALHVPSEFPTIASAINAAQNGQTILVATGFYRENINFLGKSIRIVSENGALATVIEPNNATDPTVRFTSGEMMGTELSGFTLTGGSGQHAILITNGSSPHIHHNIIRDHVSFVYNATAIGSYASNPMIEFNLFIHTRSLGGIGIFSGGGTITNNTFHDNSRGYWSQGSNVIARNNIVTNSLEFGIGDDGFAVNDFNCHFNNNSEYCCGAIPGPNDILADPLYCNPGTETFQLGPGSPCTGTGFGGVDRGSFPTGCPIPVRTK